MWGNPAFLFIWTITMREETEKRIEKVVTEHGALLVSVDWRKEKGGEVLEIAADTPSGITIDTLGLITRALLPMLDEAPLAGRPLRLEVSSPGLDNPLRFPWQYTRHKGFGIRVEYQVGDATRTIEGVCEGETGGSVQVALRAGVQQIPITDIRKAVVLTSLKSK